MIGAILTQAVAWSNVEKVIENLKVANVLSPQAIRRIAHEDLIQREYNFTCIYGNGYFCACIKMEMRGRYSHVANSTFYRNSSTV